MKNNQVKDFVDLTGATEKQAQRYLSKAKGNMQNAINLYYDDGGVPETVNTGVLPEIQNLFKKLSQQNQQNPAVIGEDGFEQILSILKIDLANPVIGHLMINIMKMQRAGEIQKKHLYNMMQYCRVSSFGEMAMKIPALEKQLFNRKDLFKSMYDGLFLLYSVTKSPTLDFDVAQELWRVYFEKIMPQHSQFMTYLDQLENKPVKIHKDLWKMMYQFVINVGGNLSLYKQEDGWPVFIDEFVEYLKNK